nr:dihydrodipicolinate synthase family protein [Candidatus Korarchaeota archaeon]NIU85467.1 dihydrodipicolinate synthase family protein [Candidatus Thorarchaeota archaeon]NIW15578.1 dihydrodipicolinate synthase family protein [Candidatus Thorarchaeota archaeon]NIW53520.1 dihydrodipicolinate synthase family protein [Candidatus Korarchaeota archaeon]
MRKVTIEGIITPMVTPFTQEGKIHEATLRDLVNFLIDGGVHGIFPISSTGEVSSLTLAEKKEIMDIV